MSIRAELEAAIEEMEADCAAIGSTPQICVFRNVALPCVPSKTDKAVDFDEGGTAIAVSVQLIIRRTHFLTADSTLTTMDSTLVTVDNDTPTPLVGNTMQFPPGNILRIIGASLSPDQSHLRIALSNYYV